MCKKCKIINTLVYLTFAGGIFYCLTCFFCLLYKFLTQNYLQTESGIRYFQGFSILSTVYGLIALGLIVLLICYIFVCKYLKNRNKK